MMRRIVEICSIFIVVLTVQSAFGMQESKQNNLQDKYGLVEKTDSPGIIQIKYKSNDKVLCEITCFDDELNSDVNRLTTVRAFMFFEENNGDLRVIVTFAFAGDEGRLHLIYSIPDGECLTEMKEA